MSSLSGAQLLTAIKNRGPIPTNDIRFKDSGLILIANEELRNTVYPLLLGTHEEFLLAKSSYLLSDHPNGLFPLPKRAYARGLRLLRYIDQGGNSYNLPRIAPNQADFFPTLGTQSNVPAGFYFYGDAIQLVGNVQNVLGSLEMTFVVKPSVLYAPDTQSRVIGAPVAGITVNGSSQVVFTADTSNLSADFPLQTGVGLYDLVRVTTGGLVKLDMSLTVDQTVPAATTFTDTSGVLLATDFSDLQAVGGDTELYLMPSGKTGYTLMPPEANQLLVVAVCARIWESLGLTDEYTIATRDMAQIKKDLQDIYANRITGQPKVLVNRRSLGAYALFKGTRR